MDRIGHGVLDRRVLDSRAALRPHATSRPATKSSRRARKSCARSRRKSPSASRRRSSRRRRRSRKAIASRRKSRSRCSRSQARPRCRRCRCSTTRRHAQGGYSAEALEAMSRLVELKLRDFGVEAEVVEVHPGPVITRFELRPAPGVKVSQISNLAKDLARSLSAISVRVVEIIPGKSTMGLEIPNEAREMVTLGEIIKCKAYDDLASPLALVLGKDIGGNTGGRRPGAHAAPAGRRHDRLGQVDRRQRDGAVAAVQVDGRARAADHDRPEDAGALGLRGHPAPARAGRDGHEAGGERAALVRRGDGAALSADGRDRRAQPRRLQPQDQGSERGGHADPGPARDEAAAARRRSGDRAVLRAAAATSSSSSTSSPT